jgi:hypothetical protein
MNSIFTLKQGAQETIRFTLYDDRGTVDLTNWAVTLIARGSDADEPVFEGVCVVDANQTTHKGQGTYTFDVTTAAIPAGTYNIEFKGVDPAVKPHYFPSDRDEPYGRLYVIANLE